MLSHPDWGVSRSCLSSAFICPFNRLSLSTPSWELSCFNYEFIRWQVIFNTAYMLNIHLVFAVAEVASSRHPMNHKILVMLMTRSQNNFLHWTVWLNGDSGNHTPTVAPPPPVQRPLHKDGRYFRVPLDHSNQLVQLVKFRCLLTSYRPRLSRPLQKYIFFCLVSVNTLSQCQCVAFKYPPVMPQPIHVAPDCLVYNVCIKLCLIRILSLCMPKSGISSHFWPSCLITSNPSRTRIPHP